jgi:cell division protein FtsB
VGRGSDENGSDPDSEASGQPAAAQDFQLCGCTGKSPVYHEPERKNVKVEMRETVKPKPDPNLTARRVIVWICAGVFVGVALLSGVFFFQTHQEYAQLVRVEAQTRQRIAQSERRMKEQEQVLERLRNDPAYVRKIIRLQLRYAKPSELIFRFEE